MPLLNFIHQLSEKIYMKYILLLFLLFSTVVTQAESEVLKMMRLSCDNSKSARACYNYANLAYRRKQFIEAKKYFRKGCKKGYAASCKQITSDSLINATFIKRKKRPTKKKLSLSMKKIFKLKSNKEFVSLSRRFCDKGSKAACNAINCFNKNSQKACNKYSEYFSSLESSSEKIAAKECDNGRIDSCYKYEYLNLKLSY